MDAVVASLLAAAVALLKINAVAVDLMIGTVPMVVDLTGTIGAPTVRVVAVPTVFLAETQLRDGGV